MSADRRIVLVGAGQCSASAASTLRRRGFEGELVLIGAEAELPYERPPLSKHYLLGASEADELRISDSEWYATNDIDVRLATTVEQLDPGPRTLQLSTGERLRYDQLLIATGGTPRQLDGVTSDRVLYLRNRNDSDRLGEHIKAGEELLILGGGFIGSEVAASAVKAGAPVTILEMQDHPLQSALGSRVGKVLSEMHRDAGVVLRTGERVSAVANHEDCVVVTSDRGQLECSHLLVAIGLRPSTDWLTGSGVQCDNGVLVDEFCRTNIEGVYAAGDVASHYHPIFGSHVRVEHYDNAIKQGAAAAANMLGDPEQFIDAHWFWSDQHGHNLQSVGIVTGYDELVIRGNVEERCFSVFYLKDGVVRSVFALNRSKDVSVGRRMVLDGFRPDLELLRNPDQDLRRMLRPSPKSTA